MNILLSEIRRSLVELDLGLAGDLTMTAPMEVRRPRLGSALGAPSCTCHNVPRTMCSPDVSSEPGRPGTPPGPAGADVLPS